jgi:hypothetical protein
MFTEYTVTGGVIQYNPVNTAGIDNGIVIKIPLIPVAVVAMIILLPMIAVLATIAVPITLAILLLMQFGKLLMIT